MNNLITNIYQYSCQGEPHFLHILKSYKKVYVICYYFPGQMRTSAGNLLPPAVNGTCEVPDNTDFCQNAGKYIIIWLQQKKMQVIISFYLAAKKRAKIMVNILLLIYGCKRYINCNLDIFSHFITSLSNIIFRV